MAGECKTAGNGDVILNAAQQQGEVISETTVTHQKGMPLGWVNRGGKSHPVFICSVTGKPITPENPGVLYWHPVTGAMMVLSDEAEDRGMEPTLPKGEGLNSMEVDVFSQMLHENSAGKAGTRSNKEARDNAAALCEIG